MGFWFQVTSHRLSHKKQCLKQDVTATSLRLSSNNLLFFFFAWEPWLLQLQKTGPGGEGFLSGDATLIHEGSETVTNCFGLFTQ